MAGLRELCEGARAAALPLLLDAEQTHRQPAIGMLARALSREYNPPGAAPLLYNTHQAYLRGAEARLREELAHARAHGYTLAVKLVRGAYTEGEVQRGNAAALQPSKAATDAAYDACAALLLRRLALADAPALAAARRAPAAGGSPGEAVAAA